MSIISDLLSTLPKDPIPVQNVVIGVHWTFVTSRFSGLGSTLVNSGPHGSGRMRDVGDLLKKTAQELASWLESDNLLEASVGMAAFNSIIDVEQKQLQPINAAEVIEREARGKNLVVIGHFPFLERMKGLAQNLWVMEQNPYGDDLPEEAAQDYVPRGDVVAITGTAFINHTIETLLPLCRQDALIMILGPSTPLVPLLFDRGISYLSGSRVVDASAAQLTIQQGAGFPQVKGVQVVTMVKPTQS